MEEANSKKEGKFTNWKIDGCARSNAKWRQNGVVELQSFLTPSFQNYIHKLSIILKALALREKTLNE